MYKLYQGLGNLAQLIEKIRRKDAGIKDLAKAIFVDIPIATLESLVTGAFTLGTNAHAESKLTGEQGFRNPGYNTVAMSKRPRPKISPEALTGYIRNKHYSVKLIDNSDGTITEIFYNRKTKKTKKIMWPKDIVDWGVDSFWGVLVNPVNYEGAKKVIDVLNRTGYLGHSDWMLPPNEYLDTILNSRRKNPGMIQPNPFKYEESQYGTWTGTVGKCVNGKMCHFWPYQVSFYHGSISFRPPDRMGQVFPVRVVKE